MSLTDLEAQLSQGAERVGKGHFKVDSQRALAKLRDFRLADPHHYVLELLRAAEASGATRVQVRNDADDFELSFDGAPFPADALSDLFGCAFHPGTDREAARLRFFALGVTGALGLKPSHVDVRSGGVALRVRATGKIEPLPPADASASPVDGTHVHVRERAGWRALREALTSDFPEARAIAEHARFFPVPLFLNGELVSGPPALPGLVAGAEEGRGPLHLLAGIPVLPPDATLIALDVHGVQVVTRAVVLPGAQLVAWARCDTLRRDASGSDVVESDPSFVEIVKRLEELSNRLVAQLSAKADEGDEDARQALTRIALGAARRPVVSRALRETLSAARLLVGPAGERLSVDDLHRELAMGRPIRTSRVNVHPSLYDPPVVLLDDAHLPLLPLLPAGPRADVMEEVRLRLRRVENKKRWEALPVEPPTLPESAGWRTQFEADDGALRGEVALLGDEDGEAEVRFLKSGRLLEEREVPQLRPLRVRAVVDSEAVMPDAAWAKVSEDAGFRRIVEVIRQTARQAILSGLEQPDPPAALRRQGRDLLADLAWWPGDASKLEQVHPTLMRAPILPLVGGAFGSLEEARSWPERRWASSLFSEGLLDGSPVLLLEEQDKDSLELLLGGPLTDVRPKLLAERRIRERIGGPPEPAALAVPTLAKVRVHGEGIAGELGILADPQAGSQPPALAVHVARGEAAVLEGRLAGGGVLRVDFAAAHALLTSKKWNWGVQSFVRFGPGGEQADGPVVRTRLGDHGRQVEELPFDVEVPAEAAEVEIWFRHWIDSRKPRETFDRDRGGRWPVGRGERPVLHRRLLRRGVLLQEDAYPARFGTAWAVVDGRDLEPTPDWSQVLPTPALARVQTALLLAQRELAGALVDWLGERPLATAPQPVFGYLSAYLVTELGTDLAWKAQDALQAKVFDAPMFVGPGTRLSLRQIADAARVEQAVWVLPPGQPVPELPGLRVVFADEPTRGLLEAVIRRPCRDARPRIETELAWTELRALPAQEPSLPDTVPLRAPFSAPGARGLVGYGGPEPVVELRVEGRRFAERRLDADDPWAAAFAGLRLCACVDLGASAVNLHERSVTLQAEGEIARALRTAAKALVERAAQSPDEDLCARLLLEAAAARPVHGAVGAPRLLNAPIFPTLAGERLPLKALDASSRVAWSTRPYPAALWPNEPVILADDDRVLAAVRALGEKAVDVTALLQAEDEAARARAESEPVTTLEAPGNPLRRRAFQDRDIEGDVGLGQSDAHALLLVKGATRLAKVALGGPPGVTAAARCARLPEACAARLESDPVVAEVRAAALDAVRELGRELARQLPSAAEPERARLEPLLARLAAWLAKELADDHPLLAAPLFRGTDGSALSARALLREMGRRGHVWAADREGSLLEPKAFVWRPREGEAALFGTRLSLADGAKHLARADEIRSRPTARSLELPKAAWREAIRTHAAEGEVALPSAPTGKLLLHVHRERRLVETLELDHPVGGTAMVDCPKVRVNATWTKVVVKDGSFDRVLVAVNQALDRGLLRMVREGSASDWRPFLPALASAWLKTPGSLADALLAVPAFEDLEGRPVTVGAALSLCSLRGKVPITRGRPPVWAAGGERILVAEGLDVELLRRLGLPVEDRTDDLLRIAQLQAAREARRLSSLAYPGEALVRLAVDTGGFRGELALPHPVPALESARVVLSRERTAVDGLRFSKLGVAGVLDHPDLQVSDAWDDAQLTDGQRTALRELVRDLFRKLAEELPRFDEARRASAATYLLRFARYVGAISPEHVDRLAPPASVLACGKVFRTASGRWVDLRALADRALRRGGVAVVPFETGEEDSEEDTLALRCSNRADPWVTELKSVLGEKRVAVLSTPAELRRHRSVEDPDDRTPLGAGLRRLRALARLLGSEAFGRLGTDELKEIRLRAGDGQDPLSYDAKAGVAVLDPAHPGVRSALEQSGEQQDGLYVLLASIYGAINRAFEHVTDEDEARLAATLLGHLAANPETPSPPPLPPQGRGAG